MSGSVSLWRIAKHTAQFSASDLSGEGAKLTGGRWNSKGVPVVYASTTIALSTLETLAHLGEGITIRNAFLVEISVPRTVWNQREIIAASDMDATWLAEPPSSTSINLGDEWLQSLSAPLLMVPSVLVSEELNALINPAHPHIKKITASVRRQFIYDPRLFRLNSKE